MSKKTNKTKHAPSMENRVPRSDPSMDGSSLMPELMPSPMQPLNGRVHARPENKTNRNKMD